MFTRILGAVVLVLVGSCGSPKKEARFIDKSEATVPFEEFRSDFNETGPQHPYQPRPLAPRAFGQEPDKVLIAGDYRQENNNAVLLELDQTLLGKFTGFSLPVIPKSSTQPFVPEFPQSWVWNATKDQYETTGRAMRPDGSMENVRLVAKTYPNFDFLDISMTVTVRPGDQIANTFTGLNFKALAEIIDADGVSYSRSRCDRDDGDDHRCDDRCQPRPRPRPRPEPCPGPDYPRPQPCPQPSCPDYPDGHCDYSCPNDPDCQPRCPDYPDGHCDYSCPNDPDCRPRCPDYPDGVCDNTCPNDPDCQPRCPTYPDGHCDGSCPNDPDCKPRCPDYPDGVCDNSCPNDPDCKPQECPPSCTTCCCTCTGGEQAQEKTFVYKFKKID